MKKAYIFIFIMLCIVGGGILIYDAFNAPPSYVPLTEITHNFTFDEAIISWNKDSKELKFNQKVYTPHNEDLEDIGVKVDFYNDKTHVGYKYLHIDKSVNGSFDVNFTVELSEHPNKYVSEITKRGH